MQYRQNSANMSCDADINLDQLQLKMEDSVKLLGILGIKDAHMTFVDDLLFPENHILQKSVHGAELTVLGGCACLAALFFFS